MLYCRVNCLFFILLVHRVNFSFAILANNAIKRKKRPYKLKIYANIKEQYFTNFLALLHQNKFNNFATLKWGLTTISQLFFEVYQENWIENSAVTNSMNKNFKKRS